MGFLTGAIDANTRFADGDIRKVESRFSPENLPHNLALVELVKNWADAEAGHARPDRAGVADGAEAVDRADPGNDPDGAHAGEHWRGAGSLHAGRTRRAECRGFGDRDPRGAPAGQRARLLGRRSPGQSRRGAVIEVTALKPRSLTARLSR